MTIQNIITVILGSLGLIYMIISLIGIFRFPDFFTRLHAQGIGDTLGAILILLAMVVAIGVRLISVKILLLSIVIMLTNPMGTNLMMIAAIWRTDYQDYSKKHPEDTAEGIREEMQDSQQ